MNPWRPTEDMIGPSADFKKSRHRRRCLPRDRLPRTSLLEFSTLEGTHILLLTLGSVLEDLCEDVWMDCFRGHDMLGQRHGPGAVIFGAIGAREFAAR